MAVVKVGPIISDIRGSIGGVTFGRNSAGLFARGRVVPVDPSTVLQETRRSQFTTEAIKWRNILTQTQRDAWNALGRVTVFKNALGDDFNPSGIMLLMRSNVLLRISAQTWVREPPNEAIIQLGSLTLEYSSSIGIAITGVLGVENQLGDVIVQISPPVSPGITFYKSPFQVEAVFPMEDFDSLPVQLKPVDQLVPDRRYFLRLRGIKDDGAATAASLFNVLTPDPLVP